MTTQKSISCHDTSMTTQGLYHAMEVLNLHDHRGQHQNSNLNSLKDCHQQQYNQQTYTKHETIKTKSSTRAEEAKSHYNQLIINTI